MPKKSEEKFDTKMIRLQEIVATLEKDNEDLDKCLKLYEEGLQLSKNLKDELAKYEEKIKEMDIEND